MAPQSNLQSMTSEVKPTEVLQIETTRNENTVENAKLDPDAVILHDTALGGLSRFQALKHFWWPILFCIMANLGTMNDGYQNQLPGKRPTCSPKLNT